VWKEEGECVSKKAFDRFEFEKGRKQAGRGMRRRLAECAERKKT